MRRKRLHLPLGEGYVSELNLLALALQSDMAFLHLVCSGVLVYAVDVNRDDTVFHEDVRFVPFSGGFLAGPLCVLPLGMLVSACPVCSGTRPGPFSSTNNPALPAHNWHSIPFKGEWDGPDRRSGGKYHCWRWNPHSANAIPRAIYSRCISPWCTYSRKAVLRC